MKNLASLAVLNTI